MKTSSRIIVDGEMAFTFEYPVRSITGIPFRPAVVTSDEQHIVVSAADKTNRDCVMVYSAENGNLVHRIPLRSCGIKVPYSYPKIINITKLGPLTFLLYSIIFRISML